MDFDLYVGRKFYILAFLLLPSILHAQARFERAAQFCLKKNYRKVACEHIENENVLFIPILHKAINKSVQDKLYAGVRKLRVAKRFVDVTVSPDLDRVWDAYSIQLDYENFKRRIKAKASNERLKACQKACLATCISSNLISPEHHPFDNWRDALEKGEGSCRSYTGIAVDIMKDLGLKAKYTSGLSESNDDYPNHNDRAFRTSHAMVKIKLKYEDYLMEPGSDSCEFYDADFNRDPHKKLTVRNIH